MAKTAFAYWCFRTLELNEFKMNQRGRVKESRIERDGLLLPLPRKKTPFCGTPDFPKPFTSQRHQKIALHLHHHGRSWHHERYLLSPPFSRER
eukprot:scaffold1950_cov75-Cyclotella_meneghiniana.AAC.5